MHAAKSPSVLFFLPQTECVSEGQMSEENGEGEKG